MTLALHLGDCLEVMRTMPDASVDAVVCDPPYGLSFMGKRWDYDVPSVEIWAECLRVLKPGGHLLAFAGTRTQHRMAVRIEDAGFEIRDMIAWVYGSGFPKSLDVSKAIDKAAGAEREVVGAERSPFRMADPRMGNAYESTQSGDTRSTDADGYIVRPITAPATPEAQQWAGWGTALKPALEPITMARKPLATCATNVLKMVESQLRERGVRGEILWKPESASGAAKSKKTANSGSTRHSEQPATSAKIAGENVTQSDERRTLKSSGKPGTSGPNQTQSGSANSTGFTINDCALPSSTPTGGNAVAVESESAISSPLTTSTEVGRNTASKCTGRSTYNCDETGFRLDTESFAGIATGLTGSMAVAHINRDSEGFFLWPKGLPEFIPGSPLTVAANVLAHGTGGLNIDGCRIAYSGDYRSPTRSSGEVNSGGSFGGGVVEFDNAKAEAKGRWPANFCHDGSDEVVGLFPQTVGKIGMVGNTGGNNRIYGKLGRQEDRQPGTTDTGSAARFFYTAKASRDDRSDGNTHPTVVKPTDLMRYLCRLVTPPGGIVLDPFMGSGSTGKAAMLEGFGFVGIEREAQYHTIAERRIRQAGAAGHQPDLFAGVAA